MEGWVLRIVVFVVFSGTFVSSSDRIEWAASKKWKKRFWVALVEPRLHDLDTSFELILSSLGSQRIS